MSREVLDRHAFADEAGFGAKGPSALPLVGWLLLILFLAGTWAVCAGDGSEPTPESTVLEYKAKAVLLNNFTLFVRWPTNAFADGQAIFRVGIVGEDPFGALLDEAMKDQEVEGRKIVIQRLKGGESLQNCQMVFVCRSERERVGMLLAGLERAPVLTVSDLDQFAERGGVIELQKPETRIHLTVNLEAARRSGLTIHSRMLDLKNVHIARPSSAKEKR